MTQHVCRNVLYGKERSKVRELVVLLVTWTIRTVLLIAQLSLAPAWPRGPPHSLAVGDLAA